ncbi:hypothetical protein D3C86_2108050 [compost metagenome]
MYVFSDGRIASITQWRSKRIEVCDLAKQYDEKTRVTGESGYNLFSNSHVVDFGRYIGNTQARVNRLR